MIKPVSEVFKEQFWQELQASHKAAIERSRFDPYMAQQDASVVQWTSEALQREREKREKK